MNPRTALLVLLCGAAAPLPLLSQTLDPVQWTLSLPSAQAVPGGHVLARLQANISPGYHIYSLSTPKGGAIPTKVAVHPSPALASAKLYQPPFERKFDQNFQTDVETFSGQEVTLLLDVEVKPDAAAGMAEMSASVRYAACTDKTCLPPRTKRTAATLNVQPGTASRTLAIPEGYQPFPVSIEEPKVAAPSRVPEPTAPSAASASVADGGWAAFLLIAFGAGLAAIFTPCVFPMIPLYMTSFLQNNQASRRQSVTQAGLFCLGIVLLFTLIGLTVTAVLGPFGIQQLGSNPWVNSFIALVFLTFGLSMLGAFEITLPSGLLSRLSAASGGTGVVSTLLMGLTFCLTSFACVGPFVGTLLASSVQGGKAQPILGMMTFAAGLSSPFFLLALFPAYLNRLPKRGGWMLRVKVVLGFVVLAASLKYLSQVDQALQWGVLTRERFLAAWVILFLLPGLYLLGLLRYEGIRAEDTLGWGRLLLGAFFLIFSLSLVPGMFGANLGELEAWVPFATSTNGALAAAPGGAGNGWLKDQYREALAKARQENKLVLVNFTGYACTNCHWMKANMFPRPAIADLVKGFVVVELYTDGEDEAARINQDLEQRKFSTVATPLYAIVDPDEKVIAQFTGWTRDEGQFAAFLRSKSPVQSAQAAGN